MVVPLAIGCNGHLSKVTRSKLKKLIQPVLIKLGGRPFLSGNGGTFSYWL